MHHLLLVIPLFQVLGTGVAVAKPEHADFVIVGGGTAGCAVAARLCTALPSAKIVLLERGFERSPQAEFLVRAPRNTFETWFSPLVSEIFESQPDPTLLGRKQVIVTGNTLGGSSSINGMQWAIPLGDDVDRWGILGLSSKVAQKFYRRAYNKVGFARPPQALKQIYADQYLKAATKAGFKSSFAPFDQTVRNSVWHMSVAATKTGRRIDSCTAYLTPALQGSCDGNLRLIQEATVTELILDGGKSLRATGVKYVRSDDVTQKNVTTLLASKEVIVSAGPYGSPKLLQLSGIGPIDDLTRSLVSPRVALPVGRQTQTRPINSVRSLYKGVPLEPSNNSTVLNSIGTLHLWRNGESSALGTTGAGTHAILKEQGYSFMATALRDTDLDKPFIGSFCVTNPAAFGSLRIRDANPFSPPEVLLNTLGDKRTLKRLRFCMKKFLRVHSKLPKSFRLTNVSRTHGVNETFLRETSDFAYHYVGGCRVGAVVRRNLNVIGVKNLRVVDASVLPTIPTSAGPMASTYMIAEYASEKIAAKYKCQFTKGTKCAKQNDEGW